jgi:hypothetical protein
VYLNADNLLINTLGNAAAEDKTPLPAAAVPPAAEKKASYW